MWLDDVAARIATLRQMGGVSQRELARLAQLSSETRVQALERQRSARYQSLKRVADVFGVSVSLLFAGEGSPPRPAAIRKAVETARAEL